MKLDSFDLRIGSANAQSGEEILNPINKMKIIQPEYHGFCVADECCCVREPHTTRKRKDGSTYYAIRYRARTLKMKKKLDKPNYKETCPDCTALLNWKTIKYPNKRGIHDNRANV